MITKIEGKCQYPGCDKDAVEIASGTRYNFIKYRTPTGLFCSEHADTVVEEGYPEYETCCPNCGCRFGVN